MWHVPQIWKGGECVIIGGGTSFIEQFNIPNEIVQEVYQKKVGPEVYSPFLSRIHNKHVIGVNMAYKLGPWIDVLYFGDEGFLSKNRSDIFEFKGLRVTSSPRTQIHNSYLKVIKRNKAKKYGITFDPTLVSWNGNSGASAINLAVHFGVKRIYLIGFDMQLDGAKNQHWHKYYKSPVGNVHQTFKKHMKGFPEIAKDLEGKVEIINCNPKSLIECFKKVNVKDVL